uniref:F-box domain-containing protein n=1 Tax=Kalanchoe fedtschenkoi TaxID=63787 RepID=A0A7N0TFF6_KALFE
MEQPGGAEAQSPHEAFYLVLPYLPVSDLLSAAQVCTSFRDAVQNDVLIWLDIHVDKPLSTNILDETLLLRIASKANGRMRSLALINCPRITDQGLHRVIHTNPLITKLYLPGCTGLSPEGVVCAVETLTTPHHKLRALKISNIHNMTKEHLESLRNCFPPDILMQKQPTYFHERSKISLSEQPSPPPIDVDLCPKCCEVRMVFDCPGEACKQEERKCRGCRYCVVRCEDCGVCVDDEVGEAACEDSLCLKCWLLLPKCDFCNKAYCKEHASQRPCSSAGSPGFVCSACLADENYLEME